VDGAAPRDGAWSTVTAGTGAVARPRTGRPSPARRILGGRRRVAAPLAAEPRLRPRVGDRTSALAYGLVGARRPAARATARLTWSDVNRMTPRRFRGPFSRWPRAADAVLASAVFLATAFVTDGPGDALAVRTVDEVPVAALLVFAVGSAALYWRRRAPLVVVGVALAAWAATIGSGYADLGGAAIIALYSVGRYAPDARSGLLGVAAAIVVAAVDGLFDSAPWGEAAFAGVVMFVAWDVGRLVRLRAERAVGLAREQAAEARRVVIEERARIARELHDVVAHRVSLMTVQAGAAKAVAAEDPEGARRAMAAVEEAGRQALDELRHLLGVLRPEADLDGLGPQPGLADLPRLVEQLRAAGLEVALATDGVPAELPARVDLFAYRIVQEALTNVLKHAGPGAHTEVRLGTDSSGIVVEVVDDGRGATAMPAAGAAEEGARGHGLVGMRERALLLGGTLDAAPRPGGGFRVVAHLPTGGEPA
jgi:signal transduction histidine kinase